MAAPENIRISENLRKTLSELIKKERLPHAILLDGGNNSSREATALFLASAFVCSGEKKPCGHCSHCRKAEKGLHPDIITVDPKEKNEKIFKVDLVRNMRTDAYIVPNEASRKVYILESADKMNIQAQNAILKIIEEPPAYARFILLCESRVSMLDTVLSRVTSFNVGSESSVVEDEDENKLKADELACTLSSALLGSTELEFMRHTAVFEKDQGLIIPVLDNMQIIFRDAAAISVGSSILTGCHAEISRDIASKLSLKTIIRLVENIEQFYGEINRNANKNLLITRLCSVLRNTAYGA